MKKDIQNRNDVEILVRQFYDRVKADPVIGYIFTDIAHVNWDKHLPVMYNFWDNAIFFTGTYTGNPLQLHRHLHHVMPLEEKHFNRWELLFTETVDALFAGPKANLAKERALSISHVIQKNIVK